MTLPSAAPGSKGLSESQRATYVVLNTIHIIVASILTFIGVFLIVDDLSAHDDWLDGLGVWMGAGILLIPLITVRILLISLKVKKGMLKLALAIIALVGVLAPLLFVGWFALLG